MKWGLLHRQMINFLFSHGNAWDFEAINVNLLALGTLALAFRLRSAAPLRETRSITGKLLSVCPITFSNNDPSVGSRLQACATAPADGQTRTQSVRSSC
jgi:hypothetical protein